jgi:hypothetical protein
MIYLCSELSAELSVLGACILHCILHDPQFTFTPNTRHLPLDPRYLQVLLKPLQPLMDL